jgi:hypothetical protein
MNIICSGLISPQQKRPFFTETAPCPFLNPGRNWYSKVNGILPISKVNGILPISKVNGILPISKVNGILPIS